MNATYKRPVLTGIFDIIAILLFIGGGLMLIAGIGDHSSSEFGMGVGLIVGGLIYIGIGQAIDFLGRTAFNTEQSTAAILQLALDLKASQRQQAAAERPAPADNEVLRVAKDGTEIKLTRRQIRQRKAAGQLSDADYYFDIHAGDWMTLDLLP